MCHGKNISNGKTKNSLTMAICRPMHRTFGVKFMWPIFDPTMCAKLGLTFSYPPCHLSAKSHTTLTI
jgi:hypothetical protein